MGFVLLILSVAVANLALGYALEVYLGDRLGLAPPVALRAQENHHPGGAADAAAHGTPHEPLAATPGVARTDVSAPPSTPREERWLDPAEIASQFESFELQPGAALAETPADPPPTTPPSARRESDRPLAHDPFDDAPSEQRASRDQPSIEPTADDALYDRASLGRRDADSTPSSAPSASDDESPEEISLAERTCREGIQHARHLQTIGYEVDTALRAEPTGDAAAVPPPLAAQLELLREAAGTALDQLERLVAPLRATPELLGDLEMLAVSLDKVVAEHRQQVEAALGQCADVDSAAAPESALPRVRRAVGDALSATLELGHRLEGLLLKSAQYDGRIESLEPALLVDPLTGLQSRAGLESFAWNWWQRDPYHARQLSMAIVDIDDFRSVCEYFGYRIGDRLLRAIGLVLAEELRTGDLAGRYAGQQFAICLPDTGPRNATSVIERVRQQMALVRFTCDEKEIPVTLSCAVCEALPHDSAAALWQRLHDTLGAAKKNGQNRTFVFEGFAPVPVTPPVCRAEAKECPI